MAATQVASDGKFPMPATLFSAFRAGAKKTRAMLILGALYAVGFLLVMGISALFDGGQFANMYLGGGTIEQRSHQLIRLSNGNLGRHGPVPALSLMFWHAPALVHWHDVSPIKALVFQPGGLHSQFWRDDGLFFQLAGRLQLGGLVLTLVARLDGLRISRGLHHAARSALDGDHVF